MQATRVTNACVTKPGVSQGGDAAANATSEGAVQALPSKARAVTTLAWSLRWTFTQDHRFNGISGNAQSWTRGTRRRPRLAFAWGSNAKPHATHPRPRAEQATPRCRGRRLCSKARRGHAGAIPLACDELQAVADVHARARAPPPTTVRRPARRAPREHAGRAAKDRPRRSPPYMRPPRLRFAQRGRGLRICNS